MSWKTRRLIGLLIGCGAVTALLVSGGLTGQGVRDGLLLCGDVVVPALFPMMVAAGFLARSGGADVLSRVLAPVLSPLFRIPAAACSGAVLSVLSGYPTGAALIARLQEEGRIDGATARRMSGFCIHAGPGMILLAVGKGLYGSMRAGWILMGCHVGASLLIGAVGARFAPKPNPAPVSRPAPHEGLADAFVNATADACRQMLTLCGFVLLFSALTGLLPVAWRAVLPVFEVTQGAVVLAESRAPLPLMAAALGFGGLSVIFQAFSLGKGCFPLGRLLGGRILHAGVSAALCAAVMRLFPRAVETAASDVPRLAQQPALIPCTVAMLLTAAAMLATAHEKPSSLSVESVV